MRESKAEPSDTMTGPITAKPGTAEYQQQFDKQALGAADSILRFRFVRVVCGLAAILFLTQPIQTFEFNVSWSDWISWFLFLIGTTLVGIDLGSVALFRKSFFLRYMMSGVNRKE